jgi:hypothetical protein
MITPKDFFARYRQRSGNGLRDFRRNGKAIEHYNSPLSCGF